MELSWKKSSSSYLSDFSTSESSTTATGSAASAGRGGRSKNDDGHKLLEPYSHTNTHADEPESHLTTPYTTQRSDESKNRLPSSRQASSSSSTEQQEGVAEGQVGGGGGGGGRGEEGDMEDLFAKLERVTLERDELKLGKERVQAMFETRLRRLQRQLVRPQSTR